jgi:enolase
LEVLDSRGNPTVEAEVFLENGISSWAMVPSGASTGKHEALELRDGDGDRYLGKGVLKAVANVNEVIAPKLLGMDVFEQGIIDKKMLELDGTKRKTNLGANAILAVSMAVLKAAAKAKNKALYVYIASLFGEEPAEFVLPLPMCNILNGGKHAIGSTDLQEFMIMPTSAKKFSQAIRMAVEVFHTLKSIIHEKGWSTAVGDEGGFAPKLSSNEEPLKLIVEAVHKAGYKAGKDIAICLDPAASEIYKNGKYDLKKENRKLTATGMNKMYEAWVNKYPIISIEDGLAEADWKGFSDQTALLGESVQIVGDDLFVTNSERLEKGIATKAANAILIKLNQIGTVSETVATIKKAKSAGFFCVVSHRSGETEDSFIADFAVGAGTGQIKTGSLCRSERTCKYNRLLKIERELEERGKLSSFPIEG